MEKLNAIATEIFCTILQKVGKRQQLKLQAEGFMDLVIQRVQPSITTLWGKGTMFSFAHYYEQEGDLMCDPEMVFIVVDNRSVKTDYQLVGIYPQMYQLDSIGFYQESISIDNNTATHYYKQTLAQLCEFANMWLQNIKDQGFLE
jgi:hypothetical protein